MEQYETRLETIICMSFSKIYWLGSDEEINIGYKLLVFCDASKHAYAAAVYLLQGNAVSCRVDLIFSKARLAPNKNTTIPRLELLAALIGVRCLKLVEKELKVPISKMNLWLDSQCVLNWIVSKRTLSTFVENRIREIKENKDKNFRYIPSAENPSDIASRGTSKAELKINKL